VTDPADYAGIVAELKANGGALSYKTRFDLARRPSPTPPATTRRSPTTSPAGRRRQQDGLPGALPAGLRQGAGPPLRREPPHRRRYLRESGPAGAIAAYTQVQGKELSYNNIADSDAAWECVEG
jgi:phosphoribosylaminoimidazolecarboxamide formyltransferase/IMP cyclohydrolase